MAETQTKTLSDYFEAVSPVLPEAAVKPLKDQISAYTDLVTQVNKWIAQVNAAKAQDPSKPGYTDYLDRLWKTEQERGNSLVKEIADRFDAIAEEYEKLNKQLREIAKANFIPEELSEEKAKETKANVNAAQPTIATTRDTIKAQMMMVESVLTMQNVALPEGGLISLLPEADSLKSGRGRKAASSSGGTLYMTRVDDVFIDGESTRTEKGGKFNYAADVLSKKFGAAQHPENAVTAEELEEAYLNQFGYADRAASKADGEAKLPQEYEFTFTKETVKTNPNDGEKVKAPMMVTVKVIRPESKAKTEDDSAKATDEKPADNSAKPATPEPLKIDTRTEAEKTAANSKPAEVPAPAKKVAPAKPAK